MARFWKLGTLAIGLLMLASSGAMAQQYQQRQEYPQYQQRQEYPQYQRQEYPRQAYRTQQPQAGQQPRTERTYSSSVDEYGRQRTGNNDHKIAVWMANCNRTEIKLGRYALNHAQESDTRQFADELVEDHESMLDKLHRFAPEAAGNENSTASSRNNGEGEDRRSRDSRYVRPWDDAAIARQISDRIARKARDELSEKEGSDFDLCFVGQQIAMHNNDLAKLEVMRQYASAELRPVIDEAIEIVDGHQEVAKDLMKDLQRQQQRGSERVSSRQRRDRDEDRDSERE